MSDRLLKESDVLKIAFQLPLVVNSAFADAVKALPSADRPQGEWIITEVHDDGRKYMIKRWCYCCSECGQSVRTEPRREAILSFVTCPYCGARMKGEADE